MNEKREVEKLIQKIIRKAKDGDAYYHYGVEYSSDQPHPWFKAYIGWSKEGVTPIQFAESSRSKLVKELEYYLEHQSRVHATVRYHRQLIDANEKAAAFHRDWITNYEKAMTGEITDEDIHS